jgi:uncharacterized protein (TIGR02246 family)
MILAASPTPASRLSPAREQAAIRALRACHNDALAAFDVKGVVALSTDDYVMILGGSGQVIQGKPAYREFVAAAFADRQAMRFVRTPDRIDVGAPDGFAVAAETGRWVGTAADGATRSAGRYLVHWTKASGAWRIVSETYIALG